MHETDGTDPASSSIMDFTPSHEAGPSSSAFHRRNPRANSPNPPPPNQQPQSVLNPNEPFEIFEWYPHFQSCLRYFLDHAQHSEPVQAVAAFVNIALPFQKQPLPVLSSASSASSPHSSHSGSVVGAPLPTPLQPHESSSHSSARPSLGGGRSGGSSIFVSLTPYLRRLIATGFDTKPILHGFFGDSWPAGIGPLVEIERRNYLFAAKSENWLIVKESYDIEGEQTIPFLKPLQMATEKEIGKADDGWSDWLAMQDWMIGPRGIDVQRGQRGRAGMTDKMDQEAEVRIKPEPRSYGR